jgi:type VI protein secretion system component Hcp
MAGKKKSGSKIKDLKPRPIKGGSREAGSVKGGKVTMQDIHFTKGVNTSSP